MRFEQIADRLARRDLQSEFFMRLIDECEDLADFELSSAADLRTLGLDVEERAEFLSLLTRERDLKEQRFCIVDIETNNMPQDMARIIEIGAVTMQNGAVISEFHSLIHTDFLPENIIALTGITLDMLENAPSEAEVIERFRLYLGESVFVAHNVDFDYTFISYAAMRHGNAPLLNRKICTIKLARKTIESPKYGLQTLREVLGINDGVLHRGLDDARSAAIVFQKACENLPKWVKTTENLIEFTKSNKQYLQPKLPFEEL